MAPSAMPPRDMLGDSAVGQTPVPYALFSLVSPLAATVPPGGERLFSNSFTKSDAVFLMLPGVSRFKAAGHEGSSSFAVEGGGLEGRPTESSFFLDNRDISDRFREHC